MGVGFPSVRTCGSLNPVPSLGLFSSYSFVLPHSDVLVLVLSYCIFCRSYYSVDVKRHHDRGNSYEERYLISAGLQFQRFSPLSS